MTFLRPSNPRVCASYNLLPRRVFAAELSVFGLRCLWYNDDLWQKEGYLKVAWSGGVQ